MKHAIIYIPGLGDHNIRGQRLATALWRWFGVHTVVCQMNWIDKHPFEPKLQKILNTIDTLHQQGYAVSLIGVSAGATAAIHAFAKRSNIVSKLTVICGAIQHPEEVQEITKQKNPAFWQAMLALHDGVLANLSAEERTRITSFVPKSDETVNPKNMRIEGISYEPLPIHGHVKSILYALTIAARRVVRSVIS